MMPDDLRRTMVLIVTLKPDGDADAIEPLVLALEGTDIVASVKMLMATLNESGRVDLELRK